MNWSEVSKQVESANVPPDEAVKLWFELAKAAFERGEGARYSSFFSEFAARKKLDVSPDVVGEYESLVFQVEGDLEDLHRKLVQQNLSAAIDAFSDQKSERAKTVETSKNLKTEQAATSRQRVNTGYAVGVTGGERRFGSNRLKFLAEEIVGLTLLEANELKAILRDEYGVEPAMGGAAIMASSAGRAIGSAAEEQTEFDVVLMNAGASKINVIKEVRGITGLGLKEAKDLVEAGGKIKAGIDKAEAEDIMLKLKAAGAEVELK